MSPEKSLQMLHTDDRLARWKMKPVYARGDNFADAMRAAEPWRTLELLPPRIIDDVSQKLASTPRLCWLCPRWRRRVPAAASSSRGTNSQKSMKCGDMRLDVITRC